HSEKRDESQSQQGSEARRSNIEKENTQERKNDCEEKRPEKLTSIHGIGRTRFLPRATTGKLTGGSVRVACVPIDFARHPHDDAEEQEERDRSHEQRVVLLAQSNVKEGVNTKEPAANHQRPRAAPEEVAAIPRDQTRRRQS